MAKEILGVSSHRLSTVSSDLQQSSTNMHILEERGVVEDWAAETEEEK